MHTAAWPVYEDPANPPKNNLVPGLDAAISIGRAEIARLELVARDAHTHGSIDDARRTQAKLDGARGLLTELLEAMDRLGGEQ